MKFTHLTTRAEVEALINWHNESSPFCVLDFETTSIDANVAELVDIQMSGYGPDEAVIFGAEFLPCLADLRVTQVWQNFKYDWKVAYRHGLDFTKGARKLRDTLLLDHLRDETVEHNLDAWVQSEYGDTYKEEFWKKHKKYTDATFPERVEYACKDIVYTGRRYVSLQKALLAEAIPESLVDHVHRLARALFETEVHGVKVDLNYTVEMGGALKTDIVRTQAELREMGGYHCEAIELGLWAKQIAKEYRPKGNKWKTIEKPDFNFASSAQVAALLYDEIGLPVQFDPKTKNRTARDEALEEIEPLHPIVPKIRELRTFSIMYGSFIEGILSRAREDRIYPSFNVNGTKSGRISHADPNMGQMPAKGEWSKIRGIFVPDPGHKLITADYPQLEVAIAAHLSGDANLLRIIRDGASQHDITAESLKIPRGNAKTLNFAMQYLCSPYKVKQLLGCSDKEAQYIWNKYWETYGGLKAFIDRCIVELEAGKPAISMFGRKRRFPGYKTPGWADPSQGKYTKPMRQYFNFMVQSPGGDMMSRAFYRTHEVLRALGIGRGWFTVHDEGLIEAVEHRAEEAGKLLADQMMYVAKEAGMSFPLKVVSSPPLDRWQK